MRCWQKELVRIRLELRLEGCEEKVHVKLILSFLFVCRAEIYPDPIPMNVGQVASIR